MTYTIDRLKEGFLKDVENSMNIERTAIEMHLQNIDLMIPVLREYDKKMVNKRLYDALSEATLDRGVYAEKMNYGTIVNSMFTNATRVGDKWQYAQHYRTRSFELVCQETDGRRLDAEATIAKMLEAKEFLIERQQEFHFDSKLATDRYERLKVIEASINHLFDSCDSLTKEALRTRATRIR